MKKAKHTHNIRCFIYLINQYVCSDNCLSVTQFRKSGIGTKGKELRSLFKRIGNSLDFIQKRQCSRWIRKFVTEIIRYLINIRFCTCGNLKRVH